VYTAETPQVLPPWQLAPLSPEISHGTSLTYALPIDANISRDTFCKTYSVN
jgi:hypothetical protein